MLLPQIHIHLSKWKWIIADHLFVQIYMEGFIKKIHIYDIWHMCLLSLLKEAKKTHFSRARKKFMSTVQVAATFSAPDWIKIGTKAPESLSEIFWASLIHPFHPSLSSFHRKRPCNFLEVEILRTKKMQRILELWGQGWVKVSAWVEGALPKN